GPRRPVPRAGPAHRILRGPRPGPLPWEALSERERERGNKRTHALAFLYCSRSIIPSPACSRTQGTRLEFLPSRRNQTVYVSEHKAQAYAVDESWPVARVIQQIADKLELRDISRYGLLLLGKEEEVRQRREELEGQWAHRRMSIAPGETLA